MRPGRHRRPGHEGHELGEPLGREPALERLEEGGELAPPREALGEDRGQGRQHGARREDVGEGQRDEGVDRPGGPLRVGVEAAQALHGVAEELDAHRLRPVRGEDVEDAAAPRHLARGGDRVLARVAPFVERLEQDLGRHLVAHAQAHDARLEEVGGEARPEEARRRRDEGPGRAGLEESRRPAGRGVGVTGQAAEGRWPRRGKREHGALEARLGGEGPQVLRHLLHVALARHHDEEGALGEEERDEAAQRADEAGQGEASRGGEGASGLGERAELDEGRQPARGRGDHGCRMRSTIAEVERPGTRATRTSRPPAASTSARPTTWSAAQSAPFTSTSGRRVRIASSGVGSS